MSLRPRSPSSITPGVEHLQKHECGAPASYLDVLPRIAEERVLRHVSSRPNSTAWASFIAATDAHSLLRARGRLADEFRSRMTRARIIGPAEDPGLYALAPSGELFLKAGSEPPCAASVLRAAGAGFTDVIVSSIDVRRAYFDRSMLLVARHCTRLRRLAVGDVNRAVFENLLRARGKRLESLSLDIADPPLDKLAAVAEYCTSLRHLSVQIASFSPRELWREVGAPLVDLQLVVTATRRLGAAALNGVKKYCRGLRHLDLDVPSSELHSNVERVCTSYGTQLDLINLHNLPSDNVRRIANACPRALFRIASTLPHIRAAGGRIHTFGPRNPTQFTDAELGYIGTHCERMQNLFLENPGLYASHIIETLLCRHMSRLSFVAIELDEDNIDDVLDVLAFRTVSIRDFRAVVKRVPSADVLIKFVEASVILERIEIISTFGRADIVPSEVLLDVADMIEACAASDSLQELLVLDLMTMQAQRYNDIKLARKCPVIANACMSLRSKAVYVNVFGMNYLC